MRGPRGGRGRWKRGNLSPFPALWTRQFCWAAHPAPAPAPAPPFTALCRGLLYRGLLIYRTLVCEWQKFLGISICLLITFQIMCCSLLWLAQKQFCYSYAGLPWIFFLLLVHWKHHGGGEANEKMFLCLHHLKSLSLKNYGKEYKIFQDWEARGKGNEIKKIIS